MKLKNNLTFESMMHSYKSNYKEIYTVSRLNELRRIYEQGFDIREYIEANFDTMQLTQLRVGLENNVDVSVYANALYDYDQMEEIRRGLESGIDVSKYVFPYLASPVMRQKRERLEYEQTLNA